MSKIILIRGAICAGKTTTARSIFEKINSSLVAEDVFKRLIDRTEATEWRDNIAFETALFLTEKLMQRKRTIIADIHSSFETRYVKYKELAEKYGYELHSFLLRPPLSVCIERNKLRDIPDVAYTINDNDVEKYWHELHEVTDEQVFSDPNIEPESIVNEILGTIRSDSV